MGGAFWGSAALHAVLLVLLVVATIGFRDRQEPPALTFELVDGAGDNFGATEAPAGGNDGSLNFRAPESVPAWTPPADSPPATQVVEAAPAKVEPKPNFTQ